MTPPTHLDGARVLAWAWSDLPFGHVASDTGAAPIAIHGLAVCRYDGEARVYRFSCDAQWETLQDEAYASEDEARAQLPAQYRAVAAAWHAP
ncbi:hypothetical protein GQ37_016560 [Janthinobacterium sp. BJB1]|uniref:hypothetical protein n=1 Tax=Janthinobacterium sp. GW458P TaxID=1981504 RepID=UPI000A324A7C|nr:hypothetical protein [Janthinobacterium sp. GW458P]MBE3027237.1 hypothetical protein [Janthinobacterium sp. GW458P]PHV15439.1 hypothetical protein CSQ90_18530 [Janthinobacterium sp. BJB303]PJC97583.1 hypothetical protein GQ37_016560 [Janthinobacterium sp. BJB1]